MKVTIKGVTFQAGGPIGAGFFGCWGSDWAFHLIIPRQAYWYWGYSRDWSGIMLGGGPLFLFCAEW